VLVLQSLPFQQLQGLLTLFSESFSSFPCGTCLLSVSHRVFSLRWSIPPNSGCTLKQPDSKTADPLRILSTRPSPFVVGPLRESHPLCFTPFHVTWDRWTVLDLGRVHRLQFLMTSVLTCTDGSFGVGRCRRSIQDFRLGLFPVHSPLLRESRLFSFPPLNKMLQFSGYSYSDFQGSSRTHLTSHRVRCSACH